MGNLKRVQNQVSQGKTIENLLDKIHGDYESFWFCDDDNIVRFVSNPTPLYKGLPFRSMSIYKWKVTGNKITAYNVQAMKLTPELSAIELSIHDNRKK